MLIDAGYEPDVVSNPVWAMTSRREGRGGGRSDPLATFRRKIDFCVIVVNCAGQRKTRRDDRRGDKLDDVVTT